MNDNFAGEPKPSKMGLLMEKRNAVIPLLVILALFGAIAFGAVGGYVWYQNQKATEITYSGPCDSRIPFTTFTDSEWGYSISYPETWFLESYKPGENRPGSAGPEGLSPEEISYYMAALATVDGNFSPQFSEDGEVMRVFLERDPIDPDFSLDTYLEQLREDGDLGTIEGRLIKLDNLFGSVVTMVSDGRSTRFVYLDVAPYTYVLNFNALAGVHQESCLAVADRIQNSFTLNSR